MAPPAADRAVAAIRRHLLPFLFLLYLVAYLDRVNVSFAAAGVSHDLGLSTASYGFAAGIFFVGYVLFEVPSNLVLARVGARRWISRILLSWGCVALLMAFMHTAEQFYGLRLLLGVAEAGFFPGIVMYLSQWVPEAQRSRTLAGFMLAIPAAGLLGGRCRPRCWPCMAWAAWRAGAGCFCWKGCRRSCWRLWCGSGCRIGPIRPAGCGPRRRRPWNRCCRRKAASGWPVAARSRACSAACVIPPSGCSACSTSPLPAVFTASASGFPALWLRPCPSPSPRLSW